MSKYIDADRLRAEIEKTYKSEIQPWLSSISAKSAIYDWVLPLIDVLQREQPKVDIEKEYAEFVDADPVYSKLVNGVVGRAIARHFAEWGAIHLNARKEETK